jgi:catechol 2,3-dioxygenase-like lactoylglutathione lyase family enzyme
MSRIQLALNVADLDASVAFYATLFGVQPNKRRPGYANFAIENPAVKLVLIEIPVTDRGHGAKGALNHVGIEVTEVAEVVTARERVKTAGLSSFDENDTTCCYALQDKVWVHDPHGAPWEVYTIKDEYPVNARAANSSTQLAQPDDVCCSAAGAGVA